MFFGHGVFSQYAPSRHRSRRPGSLWLLPQIGLSDLDTYDLLVLGTDWSFSGSDRYGAIDLRKVIALSAMIRSAASVQRRRKSDLAQGRSDLIWDERRILEDFVLGLLSAWRTDTSRAQVSWVPRLEEGRLACRGKRASL